MVCERISRAPSNFFIVFRKQSTSSPRFNYFMQTSRFRNFPPVSINTNRHRVYENFFLVIGCICVTIAIATNCSLKKNWYTSLKLKRALHKKDFIPFHSDVTGGRLDQFHFESDVKQRDAREKTIERSHRDVQNLHSIGMIVTPRHLCQQI